MIKIVYQIAFLGIILSLFSCKTEFEKIRNSNDPELMKEKADEYFENGKYLESQTLYENVIPYFRGKEEAGDLFFNYAYTHYYQSEYLLANHYFKNFGNTYYQSPKREEAMYMAAFSFYELSPNHKLDQTYTEKAINDFQLFVNTFPESDRVEEATKLIDEMRAVKEMKAYQEGQLYFDIKQYQSAIVSFENMLIEYPDSEQSLDVKRKIIISAFKLAQNSVYSKKEERYEDVIRRVDKFLAKNPRTKYTRELNQLKKNSLNELTQL